MRIPMALSLAVGRVAPLCSQRDVSVLYLLLLPYHSHPPEGATYKETGVPSATGKQLSTVLLASQTHAKIGECGIR